ncbi:MAG: TonB-dependent receptor [Woeseia sp.]|nr:TonB-dependent receptor [Woeseia sp.]
MTMVNAAVAQESGVSSIEEIVVTASKRGETSAQDLAMSISAIRGETLEAMGAVEFTDFSRSVAGLDVLDVGPGQKRYLVRGLNLPGESTVGLYYDNITMTGTGAEAGDFGRNQADLDLFDVERVEVLRGPQGTQYGANSVSGVVRIITNKPDPGAFLGKVAASGAAKADGDADYSVKGMVNIPLSDNVAVRGVGYYSEIGGFIDNVQLGKDPSCYGVDPATTNPEIVLLPGPGCLDGTSNVRDINTHTRAGGRVSLQWTPSEQTRVLFQGYYQDIDSDGRNATHPLGAVNFIGTPPVVALRSDNGFFTTPATGERQSAALSHEPYEEEFWIAAFELEHDFEWASATIAASHMERDSITRLDSSKPARLHRSFQVVGLGPWSEAGVGPGTGPFRGAIISPFDRVSLMQDLESEVTNFEARLASQHDGRFNFLAGLFYQDNVRALDSEGRIADPSTGRDAAQTDIVAAFSPASLANFTAASADWQTDPFTITARQSENTTETLAAYGEVYFDLTENLEIMGGLRWFETDRSQDSAIITPFANQILIQFGSPAGMVGPEPNTPSTESDTLFKSQITYRPTDDHQIYFQVAEGYRAGGVNATIVSTIPPSYESDQTLNLELGAKTSWLDGRLFTNLSVYQVDWDNVQFEASYTQQFNALVNCTERSDGVRAKGFELEIQAQATENLDFGFNYTSIDAEWQVDSPDCLTAAGLADTFEPPGQLNGDSLIGVPDYSGSAYLHYNFDSAPLGAESGFVRFDLMYQGKVKVNDDDLDENLSNPSYVLANANAVLDYGKFSVGVFIRNIADEEAHLSLFQGLQSDNRVTPSNPRTIGAYFTYNFGDYD